MQNKNWIISKNKQGNAFGIISPNTFNGTTTCDGGVLIASDISDEENAKLIAAAPDLLKACRAFAVLFEESDMRPEDECYELSDIIDEAIKKATE